MEGDYFSGPLSDPEVCSKFHLDCLSSYIEMSTCVRTILIHYQLCFLFQPEPNVYMLTPICTVQNSRVGKYKRNLLVNRIRLYNLQNPQPN